ncbi:MG2 domain-containing protein [Chitinophagaceae bacterium LB-8]|uniref:MG2 domain-containing protein n=1 Tax=Paraflavisolibacter caeni TaxID=2982496 RepID=A0A9X2XVA5_9BACT|nr:MG2 domain-containing protein [Paraflavisolibacter caeni]MCU7548373.1 MG2 domain-containing protein [Paraflavisolibacter caeni]
MRNKFFLATALLVAIFLSACNRDTVALSFTNAKGEVPQLGNLVFRFNKSLIADSLLNNWDSTKYVSFEPDIPGRFRWETPSELVFSPLQPLKPATSYKAKVRNDVLQYTDIDKVKDADEISFYTSPLQLADAQVTWVLKEEGSRTPIPQIALQFNYPVKPEELKDKLAVEVDGTKMDYTLQTISPSDKVSLRLEHLKAEDKNYEAKISIASGLLPLKGSNKTADEIKTILSIPSPFVLNINNVEAEHDGTEGIVHITTSQQLTGENIASLISFDPAVKFTTEQDDFGVTLRSNDFSPDEGYALTVQKGLRGKIGGVLRENYNGSVAFGSIAPDIQFTNTKAVYLSKRGGGNIEVRITNVPKVKLIISKIYENNLLMAERNGYYPDDEYDEEEENEYSESEYASYRSESIQPTAGDIIYSKEIDTRTLPKSGAGRILNLSQFEDRLPEAGGIYHVKIRSVKDYWVSDSRFISLSDIGLIAKQGADKMYVFANSIKTATALDGITINVYGSNNQLIGTGATNSDGVAEVQVEKRDFAGFKPAMVIAKTANDFNYLPFNNTRVNTSRFDVGGKRDNPTGFDAFIYAERDIYRPGEKVNFSVLLRDRKWKSPGALPIKMKFLLPNGKELKSFRKNLNEQGSVEGNVDISTAAITGSYLLEIYSSNDVLLASKNFMIEEFVPDRIRLTTKLDKPYLRPQDKATLSINAVNFFGPPAANRNYETEIQIKQKKFIVKSFNQYDFDLDNQQTFFDKDVKEGKTDANGNAIVTHEIPGMYANIGLLQASFYSTVFDETGRPVSRMASADVYTQDVFHGIKDDGYYYYALNQPVKFQMISVNRDGVPTTATARVKVIKHEYRTVLAKRGTYFRYDSQEEDKLLADKEMVIGNGTDFIYIPRSPGDYEVRIYRPGANAYVSKKFYSYGSWGANISSFEVNTEGQIDISLDKEKYNAGETAKVLFKTPFSGRMLVTTETDGVLTHQYLDVVKRIASIDLKLTGEHVPNVYVTATLFKPHEISDIPLTVAHGFQNIAVEDKGRKMPVAITAQKSVRSKTHQKVRVKAAPGSFITLAAVDNGVLQVSDFKTPDPYQYYYQKKALSVAAFDLYPLLFPEVRPRLSSTGGDMSMEKRVNPMPARRFKILSYWSGIKKANGSGVAEFEFDIPQFSGEVRLMAVAYKDEQFGSAEATTTVADPVVLSSSLPRFLSPGDTVLMPVTISNTTTKVANGQATISATGPIKPVQGNIQNISLNPNSETQTIFKIVADQGIGVAKVSVNVSAIEEKFTEETEISIRPPSTLQKVAGSGSMAGGSIQRIAIPANDFLPGSSSYELVVSRSPVTEIADQIRYLVQYPYGCTEQTISAAFPQLYFADFSDLLNWKNNSGRNANTNVIEAIRRIKMRQLYNGAVTLWDGEGAENWWTTAYAAHFLIEARKAGFDVDNSLLETMLGYLTERLKTKQTFNYIYNRNQQRKIAPKEVPYSLYVLALANRSQVSAMNYYKANQQYLALDGKYLLSAAYSVSGDRRSFTALLPRSFSGEESVQQTGGSFYSATRDESIALNALIEVDPGNAQIPVMAKHITQRLKTEPYLNTQERSFAFLALGKLARSDAKSNVTAEIKSNGKTIAKINGNDWRGGKDLLKSSSLEIATKGSGRLYYAWQAEGISRSGAYTEEDNFIKVRRTFFDRYGREITGKTFAQNDLIIVGITLEKAYSNTIENIVITDLLPAGFEIENPRTKELPGMDWIKNASEPLALDVRDDRIHFFVDARSPKQTYYYAVRAVSLGQFKQGPVSADAMYNGEIHSYHGAQSITVVKR